MSKHPVHPAKRLEMTIAKNKAAWNKRKKEVPINKPIRAGVNARAERNQKLRDMAERLGIDPDSHQVLKLWEEVKHAPGFQIKKKRGDRKRNTPSDTWRENMFKLSVVADYMHRKGKNQTDACKGLEIDKELLKSQKIDPTNLSSLIREYEGYWDILMHGGECEEDEEGAIPDGLRPDGVQKWRLEGKTVAANNKKYFTDMMRWKLQDDDAWYEQRKAKQKEREDRLKTSK